MAILDLEFKAYYNITLSKALKANVRILNLSFLRITVTIISFFLQIILIERVLSSIMQFIGKRPSKRIFHELIFKVTDSSFYSTKVAYFAKQ